MLKRWEILPKQSDDIIEQLLINRGIDPKDKEMFLNPNFEQDLFDPFLLPDMKAAIAIIKEAIKKGEKIGIFADFDADGTPAAAFLTKVLEKLKASVEVYIPSREEGYGLNQKGIVELKNLGCRVLLSCDLGVANDFEVAFAKKLGLKVIILDHHLIQEDKYPKKADCVIHPKRKDAKYPFLELCGGGLSFKLSQALFAENPNIKIQNPNFLKWNLDLPAVSTITDMVPLVSENRVIAKFGLIVLAKTQNLGLKNLYEVASIDPANMGVYTVSFQIGPRINAPGRMDHASLSYFLLVTENAQRAQELALKLNQINQERQALLDRVLNEAKKQVLEKELHKKKVIMVTGKNWPSGIVGLVAGKLMEQFTRPVLVLDQGPKVSRGSARSIDAFHLLEAFEQAKDYLLKHGGHAKAAGVSLANEHLETVYDILLKEADARITEEDLIGKVTIDGEVKIGDLNPDLYQQLKLLEPHGLGNPRPTLLLKNVPLLEIRQVGNEGKHLKLKVENFSAIGFDLGGRANELKVGDNLDVVFNLDENNFNGTTSLQLKILDFKKS